MDRFLVDAVLRADLPAGVRAQLDAVQGAMVAGEVRVVLPTLRGVRGEVLARWCLRRWIAAGSGVPVPFSVLDPIHLGLGAEADRCLAGHLDLVAGGWVFVGGTGGPPAASWAESTARRGIRWMEEGAPRLELPAAVGQLLGGLDGLHAVALDPALARVREALSTRCASGDAVLLEGRPGSGRSALIRWAHAALGAPAPLIVFTAAGSDVAPADAWLVAHEPADLSPCQRRVLRERLHALGAAPGAFCLTSRSRRERPTDAAFAGIIGEAPPLVEALLEVKSQALVGAGPAVAATVLLLGETGTGKEALAEAVHVLSGRRGRYVRVDLGEIPAALVENALFGHKRGAFTGAHGDQPGLFEQAHGGTLFLDEVGNLPVDVQEKLLRVLESGRVRRIGDVEDVAVDVRVVAATSRDLAAMLRRGELRQDLWYRLARREVVVPALRDRPDDVVLLAEHALARCGYAGPLPEDVRSALEAWGWPGNVRELLDRVTSAVNRAAGGTLTVEHLRLPRGNQPTLITTARPAAEAGLDADLLPIALAVRLRVPTFEERSRRQRQQAILDTPGGRPWDPLAVHALENRAWWGGLRELGATLRGLAGGMPGPVDLARLASCLPEPEEESATEPLVVWMHAFWNPREGRVEGVTRVYEEEALVVGRGLRSVDDVGWELDEERRERLRASVAVVRAEVGDRSPAVLALDDWPTVSRMHLMIVQRNGRLRVLVLPGARFAVRVETPSDPEPRRLAPGERVTADRCARIDLLSREDKVVTRLLVAVGHEAPEEMRSLLERSPIPRAVATQGLATQGAVAPDPNRVWRLNDAERDAVVDLLSGYVRQGRAAFAPFIADRAAAWEHEAPFRRLARFLDRTDPGYRVLTFSRLLDFEPNRELRDRARAALAELPVEWLERLPVGVQRALWTRPPGGVRLGDARE